MLLGISEIHKLIRDKNLLENLSERELEEPEGCVIDLRLDKVFDLVGNGYIGIEERKTPDAKELASFDSKSKTVFTFNPNDYYLTKTVENINLPENIAAMFKPRSTLFRSGMILRTGFANPGYNGPLFFGLFNGSKNKFEIEMGARYCSVYFLTIRGKIKNKYRGQWQGGRKAATKLEKQI